MQYSGIEPLLRIYDGDKVYCVNINHEFML